MIALRAARGRAHAGRLERLSPLDVSNLRAEDLGVPMHVAALAVVEAGPLLDDAGRLRLEKIRGDADRRLSRAPRLRQVLCRPAFGLGPPLWADDAGFDIAEHVLARPVPAPGDEATLLRVCAELNEPPLDRSRPLWELWLVTGLADGNIGMLLRLHHAVADGIAALALMGALFDPTAVAPSPAAPRWSPVPRPSAWALLAGIFGKVEQISAVDPATAGKIFDVNPLQGSIAGLGRTGIAVYKDVAAAQHLKVGSTVPMLFKDTGLQRLRVALIYGDAMAAPARRYFLGTPAFDANFAIRYDSQVFVKKAPAVTTAAALAAVRKIATRYSGTSVMDQNAFKQEQAKPIQQELMLVYALLALAVLIALLGIGNTLALSIFERTRELGVMRAVGMTRRQLRATIRWESVIIALQGTLLGLLIGVFFGWVLVLAMKNQGITVFSVPVLSLAIVVVLAGVAGVAAAILPSRRAAKLNILRAIVSE